VLSVTRERIRQIEKIALGKLRRTVQTTRLNLVNDIANRIIEEKGGIMLESKLVSEIINIIKSEEQLDGNIIKLALSINPNLNKIEKTNTFRPFWRIKNVEMTSINAIQQRCEDFEEKSSNECFKLLTQIRQALGPKWKNCNDQ
jgi:hypothetical protein